MKKELEKRKNEILALLELEEKPELLAELNAIDVELVELDSSMTGKEKDIYRRISELGYFTDTHKIEDLLEIDNLLEELDELEEEKEDYIYSNHSSIDEWENEYEEGNEDFDLEYFLSNL